MPCSTCFQGLAIPNSGARQSLILRRSCPYFAGMDRNQKSLQVAPRNRGDQADETADRKVLKTAVGRFLNRGDKGGGQMSIVGKPSVGFRLKNNTWLIAAHVIHPLVHLSGFTGLTGELVAAVLLWTWEGMTRRVITLFRNDGAF